MKRSVNIRFVRSRSLDLLRTNHSYVKDLCYLLVNRASSSIQRNRRWNCIGGSVPGSVEADAGQRSSSGDAAVVRFVLYRHRGAALRFNAVPERRNRLSVGKGPRQRPTGNCSAAVDNRDCRSKCAGVLRRNHVVDRACAAAGRNDGKCDGGGCGGRSRSSGDGHCGGSSRGRGAGREGQYAGCGSWVGAVGNSYSSRQSGGGKSYAAGKSTRVGDRDGVGRGLGLSY